ncbi:uncharacterized protein V6R79_018928 [Siganus canaliculatus]
MLDFLVETGEISEADGLLATWVHGANSKADMNAALASDVMILESDITVEGYGTPEQKPIPIMAHPPDVYSDNTLDEWLDAVVASRKAMKLDFKALDAVGVSLDLLLQKNSSVGINRPVWVNADILRGPNVPEFIPRINGTMFLQLVEEKFPDVTLSPGWQVLYPALFNETYDRSMMENMYNMIKDHPQKVTFPVHAMLVRSGWQHLSWLLSQSSRFTLTLWQGSVHNPTVEDLLFVRDNTHPSRVYYDIYEPALSEFKAAAGVSTGRLRRFYPGGDLMDFLSPVHPSFQSSATQRESLEVRWFTVSGRASMLAQLSDAAAAGMLMVPVVSDSSRPELPLVAGSGTDTETFTLQEFLQELGQRPEARWGVYLRIQTLQLLEASLELLDSAYGAGKLYRPVWIGMDGPPSTDDDTKSFLSAVEKLFPYVTLVLTEQNWPPLVPAAAAGLSQRVALHLNASSMPKEKQKTVDALEEVMDACDVVVEADDGDGLFAALMELKRNRGETGSTNLYVIPGRS